MEEGGKIEEREWSSFFPEAGESGSMQKYEENTYWRPRDGGIVLNPTGIALCRLGGGGSFNVLPELHDAALKVLTKHGIPISRDIRLIGLLSVRDRNSRQPTTQFLYTYDTNDAEEARRAKAISDEWATVSSEITGTKTAHYARDLGETFFPSLVGYYLKIFKPNKCTFRLEKG